MLNKIINIEKLYVFTFKSKIIWNSSEPSPCTIHDLWLKVVPEFQIKPFLLFPLLLFDQSA